MRLDDDVAPDWPEFPRGVVDFIIAEAGRTAAWLWRNRHDGVRAGVVAGIEWFRNACTPRGIEELSPDLQQSTQEALQQVVVHHIRNGSTRELRRAIGDAIRSCRGEPLLSAPDEPPALADVDRERIEAHLEALSARHEFAYHLLGMRLRLANRLEEVTPDVGSDDPHELSPWATIGAIVGISDDAAKTKVRRFLQALLRRLQEDERLRGRYAPDALVGPDGGLDAGPALPPGLGSTDELAGLLSAVPEPFAASLADSFSTVLHEEWTNELIRSLAVSSGVAEEEDTASLLPVSVPVPVSEDDEVQESPGAWPPETPPSTASFEPDDAGKDFAEAWSAIEPPAVTTTADQDLTMDLEQVFSELPETPTAPPRRPTVSGAPDLEPEPATSDPDASASGRGRLRDQQDRPKDEALRRRRRI